MSDSSLMSSLVLFLVLCFSLHACSARHLRVIYKDVEKAKLSSMSEKLKTQENFKVEDDIRNGPNTISKAFWMEEKETKEATSGEGVRRNKSIVSSSQEGLQLQSTKIMERKRQARSILAFQQDNTEEAVNTSEPIEDVVVMDYAQPHRKPPIHNRKP